MNSDEAELLGLTIDKELNFSKHIDKLCCNAQYKLHTLIWIRKYLSLENAKMLGSAFSDSQFNYAPLIWMFCRKGLYLKMQKIHHKTLKVIYRSKKNLQGTSWTEWKRQYSSTTLKIFSYWGLQKYFLLKPQVCVLFFYS